ncbi:MAG: tetratricopeptide repeat protein [Acidobacteria bacterium]|nr:tetratricopeptide repeat protein [Acidobacteriota bacterium]MBV9929052.1 tetratricopeptide repeat protein [Acidobacteriota bacterium]
MPADAARSLVALSAAVALTDEVASTLIKECVPTGAEQAKADAPDAGRRAKRPDAGAIVACLHACDFVYARNGEWHLDPAVRATLLDRLEREPEVERLAHSTLRDMAQAAAGAARRHLPAYLTWPAGLAYHTTALDQQRGREIYAAAARDTKYSGSLWLLGVLSREQLNRGRLPQGAVEPYFFEGMTAYHEGRWEEAERNFRQVAKSDEIRIEVSIALHVLGRIVYLRRNDPEEAAAILRRSLAIEDKLGNRHGQALVLNTLATVVGKEDPKEAEGLLRRSLEIGRLLGDEAHQAQALNSLGALTGQQRPDEAEGLLRRSLELRRKLKDLRGQAQTLQSLANLIRRSRPAESEELLTQSLDLDRQLGNLRGQAQVLLSLAILVWDRDPARAVSLFQESLKINERLGDVNGQAKVLNSLGTFYLRTGEWEPARSSHQRAAEITNDSRSLATAYNALSKIAEEHDGELREAARLLGTALHFARKTGRAQFIQEIEERLFDLERRIADSKK